MVYGESLDSGLAAWSTAKPRQRPGRAHALDMQPYLEKAEQIQTASAEQ